MKAHTKLVLAHAAVSIILVILCVALLPKLLRAVGSAAAEVQKGYEAQRDAGPP